MRTCTQNNEAGNSQTARRHGVVKDPNAANNTKKESSQAMLLSADERGWVVVVFAQTELLVRVGRPAGLGRVAKVNRSLDAWFELGEPWEAPLEELDALLMRKDPPFDMEYVYSTYILQLAEQRGLLVVNSPSSLREINEKFYTAWFPDCTPTSLITRSRQALVEFLNEHGKVVLKPLDGMGGRSIFVVAKGDINTNVVIETLTDYGKRYTLCQRYIPEISDGDKRILLIDGVPIDYALARIPAPGESRGNLVMGASGVGRELTERDRWIANRVGPILAERGVLFAGLDVIGDYLTEINVTSPTGIRELDAQFGIRIADGLLAAIEQRVGG
ncbi:MAG: glutathione synthase [Gammaproteobacteria bacterium]|nr:glutathione synthase [Gammaproteobacteria bacterium]